MSIFGRLFGKGEKPKVRYSFRGKSEFDYSAYPENFIVKMESGIDYTVKRGSEVFSFSVCLKPDKIMDSYGSCRVIWNHIVRETRVLRPKKLVPYLVHADGCDHLYMYEHRADDVTASSIGFTELNDGEYVIYSDYTQKGFLSEPTDPSHVLIARRIYILGGVYAPVEYHVAEHGKLVENEKKEYYYCDEKFRKQKFVTIRDCRVPVFTSRESREATEQILPRGSVFTRLRTDDVESTDLLLEDGRVFRVTERYLFSEPRPFMELTCADGGQFEYKELAE